MSREKISRFGNIYIVDQRCYCNDCKMFGSKLFYRIDARCLNCGSFFIAQYRNGDTVHSYSIKCPVCECEGHIMAGAIKGADDLLDLQR